jgi:hypothetical protein
VSRQVFFVGKVWFVEDHQLLLIKLLNFNGKAIIDPNLMSLGVFMNN